MSRIDDNRDFIDAIKEMVEKTPIESRCMDIIYRPTIVGALLDMSVSLAIIADKLEVQTDEK